MGKRRRFRMPPWDFDSVFGIFILFGGVAVFWILTP